MKVARKGWKWLRAITPILGATTLGATLALALVLVCLSGPKSQAAPLAVSEPPPMALAVGAALGDPTRTLTSTPGTIPDAAPPMTVAVEAASGDPTRTLTSTSGAIPNAAPPIPILIRPANGTATRLSVVEFAWTNVGAANYNLRVDGIVYTTTATVMSRSLADGAHNWSVRALDVLGASNGYTDTWTVTVDTTPPPRPTLTGPQNGLQTNSPSVEFTWSNVGAASYNLRLDGAVYVVAGTSSMRTLGEGDHTWSVEAVDTLGNASGYTDPWTVTVDTTPPPRPALLFPANNTATPDPSVDFGWENVGAATYHLKVDGVVYSTPATSKRQTLAEGPHSWSVQALDALGNASGYTDTWTVTVDTTPPPRPALLAPANGARLTSANVQFSWTDVQGATAYRLWLDGNEYATTSSSLTRSLADGGHVWTAQALDLVGNASGYTTTWALTVDTVPPTVAIVAPANGALLTRAHLPSIVIAGTASDGGTGIDRVEVDTGSGWQAAAGTSNWTFVWTLPLADAQARTLRARAFDRAGNVSALSQVAVTLDTVAPIASTPVPDRSPWVTETVVYDWSVSLDGSGIVGHQIRVYNTYSYDTVFDVSGSLFTFNQATEESAGYYAQARALDGAGNWGAWSAPSVVVIPDLTLPNISNPSIVEDSPYLHAIDTRLYYTNEMKTPHLFYVTGYSSDAPSGVRRVCFSRAFGDTPACDTAGFLPWSSGAPDYGVDPGSTASGVIRATVYDYADNRVIQTYTYELDETPPDSTANAPAYATSRPIRVAWMTLDTQSGPSSTALWYKKGAGGTWAPAPLPPRGGDSGTFVFEPLEGDGLYFFATVAQDNVGNLESAVTAPETQTVYDTTAPTSEVTWAPPYWNDPAAPITMTWVATPSLQANPVVSVSLWYRFDDGVDNGAWDETGLVGWGQGPGTFSFWPLEGDGRYHLETVAWDSSGKSEANPYGDGDRTVVYDTQIGAPIGLSVIPSNWTTTDVFTVTWTNPADLSGIAAAYYKVGDAPGSDVDGIRVPGIDRSKITGIRVPSQGRHALWVWLEDRAGNVDHTTARGVWLRYDASVGAPIGLAAQPAVWTPSNAFTVTWSNPTDLSSITGAYYKLGSPPVQPDDGIWVPGGGLSEIGEITVAREGRTSLYLWLTDLAGNVDLSNRRSVDLLYDPSPPTDVTIQVPESTTDMTFEVRWSANFAASGIGSYTVEYSGTADMDWRLWLSSVTQTSELFTAPVAGAVYAFRVTAYDRAGNSAQAQSVTTLEPQRIFMPAIYEYWRYWYVYDVYEPNDTFDEAYELVKSGQLDPLPYIWDATDLNDYYHFTPVSTTQVRIFLTGIPQGADYDLYVYDSDAAGKPVFLKRSVNTGNQDEEIRFVPVPGRKYWVRVYPFQGSSNTHPYYLTVVYR